MCLCVCVLDCVLCVCVCVCVCFRLCVCVCAVVHQNNSHNSKVTKMRSNHFVREIIHKLSDTSECTPEMCHSSLIAYTSEYS